MNSIKVQRKWKHPELWKQGRGHAFAVAWTGAWGTSLMAELLGNRWKILRTQVQPKFHVSNSQNTHLRGHQHANTWWMQRRAKMPLPANQSSTKLERRAHGVNLSRHIIIPFKVSRLTLLKIMHSNCLFSKSKFCFEAFSTTLLISRWLSNPKIRAENPCL